MTPPRFLVSLVKLLLPRACREHVLGDLHERYTSPLGYITDALTVVPAEIIGQIRKAMPLPWLAAETFLVYASFFAAPRLYGDADGLLSPSLHPAALNSLWSHANTSQLFCITAVVMAGLLRRDAYPESNFSRLRQIAALKQRGLDLALTPFRLRLFAALKLAAGTYHAIYFSCAVAWTAQLIPFVRPVFPGIMTELRGTMLCGLVVVPFRLWIAMRSPSSVAHNVKHQN